MIIGLLICTIGLMPLVLALSLKSIYKESKLSTALCIYMLLVAIWQLDVGILYFADVLSEEVVLVLFKLFRIGPTFSVPIVFYIAHIIIKNEPTLLKENNWGWKILIRIFDKKVLYFLIVWSSIIYFINWSSLGIEGLNMSRTTFLPIDYYFPLYGSMHWAYFLHMCGFVLLMILVFLATNKMINSNMRNFLRAFCMYSIIVIVSGFLNFFPEMGVISSSIGVIIFSVLIVHEFIKMNTHMKSSYYQLMERQKKLDYTGNLAGSLIHEVKNTNQIIKGFSSLLGKNENISEKGRSALEMIQESSDHLEGLVNNYKNYLEFSAVSLKKENLELIINRSIAFLSEMLNEHDVKVEFTNNYQPLEAYVNKANLEQVFINLIKNSVESMPEEREDKKIVICTEVIEESIVIHLHDTGKGIPQGNWEVIFDPFISFSEAGMGLGLPFVKKTIIEHLGNIYVVQSSSEGTHFQMEIPKNGILNSN
ncbi:sensor histidine kinase [Aquibacillus rhizosphaerae]|uniref:histidine kinase n=1 Tax=Aquibacillus rhizosphaerae TaxID=3051431 RepID=A0ABT7LB50_9BACI|nr:HAMP domain-containing sensor histidine kinase [Aquibacillus sp. LR5S19]MDL4841776.1 HAMP domain-containing sensor histidine kinase [Aquibacillus sp. LR5S19]